MKKVITIATLTLTIILVGLYMVTSTYAVIIEVIDKNGVLEIINNITAKDILTNADGSFNNTYYEIKNELDLTDKEANILLDSKYVDEALKKVLTSIAEYKIKNKSEAKLSDEELYQLIADAVLKTNNLADETKSRVINKASLYRKDISRYMYDLEVSLFGEQV